MIKVKLFNDNYGMRDIDYYGEVYGFEATLVDSYYDNEIEADVDEWILEGEEEDIESFIEDYCLEEVVIKCK